MRHIVGNKLKRVFAMINLYKTRNRQIINRKEAMRKENFSFFTWRQNFRVHLWESKINIKIGSS